MVPLPAGDLSCPKPNLKLPSTPSSPIIDPRLSPDGSMLAYVRDYELHIMNLLNNETKQVKFGDSGLHDDHRSSNQRILRKVFRKKDCRHINGFPALLDEEEVVDIAKHPNVISVFLNKGRKLDIIRSWNFLGVEIDDIIPSNSIWKKPRFGKDTIIGNLDTGAR